MNEKKQLINAMATVIGDKKLKDADCGVVCYGGSVYIASSARLKCITKDGEYYFAGFREVKNGK